MAGAETGAAAGTALAEPDQNLPFPESAFVVSAGLRLHYRHWLPGSAPVGRILLIHGFGSSTFSFRFLLPELLAAGWEVAAVDIPPFGYSDKSEAPAKLGFDRGSLLWAVPDALGWKGGLVLLGHSMGALYATAMTEKNPERVAALVFLAGAVPVGGKGASGPLRIPRLFTGALDSFLHSRAAVGRLLGRFAGGVVPEAMIDGYFAPYQLPGGAKALLSWSEASAGQPPVHPERLAAPCLLVWGEKDRVVPVALGRKLAAAIRDSRLVVLPGLGHLAHELQSALVDPVIMAFLAGLAG
jgi:pimeloyl-ACP methyl ester carboxylesterase